MDNERFIAGQLSTRFLEEEYPDNVYRRLTDELRLQAALAVAIDKCARERRITIARGMQGKTATSNWLASNRRAGLRNFGGSR
jgi:hypothetical protein